RYRMLVGSVLHWPLTLRGKGIVSLKVDPHAGESLGLHRRAVLLKAVGRVARQAIIRCKLGAAFIAQLVVESLGSAEHENVFPMVSIVDRHMPVNGVTIPHGRAAEGSQVRHDDVGDPQIALIRSGIS